MRIRLVILALAALGLSGCDNTTARYSSDYATRLQGNDLIVLPPYAEAYMQGADGSQSRMYDYEGHVEPILAAEVQKQLNAKGYRAPVLHKKDLMINKTYQEYAAFKDTFVAAYKSAYAGGEMLSRDKAKNSVVTLSGRANQLGQKLGAHVFVYIDYNETVKTSGGQALDFAAGVAMQMLTGTSNSAPPDKAKLVIALIDADTDKVLWMNPGISMGGGMVDKMVYTDDEQSQRHIRNSIAVALRELPDRSKLFEKK